MSYDIIRLENDYQSCARVRARVRYDRKTCAETFATSALQGRSTCPRTTSSDVCRVSAWVSLAYATVLPTTGLRLAGLFLCATEYLNRSRFYRVRNRNNTANLLVRIIINNAYIFFRDRIASLFHGHDEWRHSSKAPDDIPVSECEKYRYITILNCRPK